MNAVSVPIDTISASRSNGTTAASAATANATITVFCTGVIVRGFTFANVAGSSPSRPIVNRIRVWPYSVTSVTENIEITAPAATMVLPAVLPVMWSKIGVLVLFSAIAFTAFDAGNFKDLAPFGVSGISLASGTIFFAYIGLDAVSTAGDEVKDPQHTMPRAIIAALLIVTAIHLLVSVAAVGAQRWQDFKGEEAVLAVILDHITGNTAGSTIVAAGAVISIFSVTLVTLYGQTRILFTMGRDGLLPATFAKVNPRTMTPVRNTMIVAFAVAVLAAVVPLDRLAEIVSIGTLTAFIVVSAGVIVLRIQEPDLPRGFKVPGYPVTPVLSIAACAYILFSLHWYTWIAFSGWLAVALTYYLMWGRRHSALNGDASSVSFIRD